RRRLEGFISSSDKSFKPSTYAATLIGLSSQWWVSEKIASHFPISSNCSLDAAETCVPANSVESFSCGPVPIRFPFQRKQSNPAHECALIQHLARIVALASQLIQSPHRHLLRPVRHRLLDPHSHLYVAIPWF